VQVVRQPLLTDEALEAGTTCTCGDSVHAM
jgi:hypothetical protein